MSHLLDFANGYCAEIMAALGYLALLSLIFSLVVAVVATVRVRR